MFYAFYCAASEMNYLLLLIRLQSLPFLVVDPCGSENGGCDLDSASCVFDPFNGNRNCSCEDGLQSDPNLVSGINCIGTSINML